MPVSPATASVREAFIPDDRTPPVDDGEGGRQVAGDEPGGRSRTGFIALVGACILAFALGFAGMTALTRGSDGAPRSNTKPAQPAPATSALSTAPGSSTAKAPTSAPAPPSSALVGAVANDQAPVPQSSPPPMPRTGEAGPPTPSTTTTTTPAPSTTMPTTTPSTTTP